MMEPAYMKSVNLILSWFKREYGATIKPEKVTRDKFFYRVDSPDLPDAPLNVYLQDFPGVPGVVIVNFDHAPSRP